MSDNIAAQLPAPPATPAAAPEYPEAFKVWLDICKDYPYLRYLASAHGNEAPPPRPMLREAFAALVGSLRDKTHGPILRELLLDLLAEGIDELAVNAIERCKCGRRTRKKKTQPEDAAGDANERPGQEDNAGAGEDG